MTYKASIAGLNLGGGKAVIIGNPKKDKTEKLFRSFGRFVEGLGGRYITAEDVGTNIHDMENVRIETNYVTGICKVIRRKRRSLLQLQLLVYILALKLV